MKNKFLKGAVEGSTIAIVLLTIALVGTGAFGVWAYIEYSGVKNNIESQVEVEVQKAVKDEADKQAKEYAEREKNPTKTFNAPTDLGGVNFEYSKQWSAYVAADGRDGKDYFAYLHPNVVPPIPANPREQQRYALRVAIYHAPMDEVLKEYQKAIEKGELSSDPSIANGKSATKLEGLFPNNANKDDRIRGVAYFFKVNDKVLMLKTDADTFRKDFNDIILKTLKF